jgi:hypothetical protein
MKGLICNSKTFATGGRSLKTNNNWSTDLSHKLRVRIWFNLGLSLSHTGELGKQPQRKESHSKNNDTNNNHKSNKRRNKDDHTNNV